MTCDSVPGPTYNSFSSISSPFSRPPICSDVEETLSESSRPCQISSKEDSRPMPSTRKRPSSTISYQSLSPFATSHISPRSPTPIPLASPNSNTCSTTDTPPSLSRSQPLLGSYSLSLLHSRMSGYRPHVPTSGFTLHLGAVGKGKNCPKELRCPAHLVVPFEALYYDLDDDGQARLPHATSPWVANVGIRQQYLDMHTSTAENASDKMRLISMPPYPGYSVARRGQLQILIKIPGPSATAKIFVVPYDLRPIPERGRLLIRENTYVRRTNRLESEGESLRYAIQLQFICLPESSGSGNRHESMRKLYYVTKSIRVIFSGCPPDKNEELRIDRTEQVIDPTTEILPSSMNGGWGNLKAAYQSTTDSGGHDQEEMNMGISLDILEKLESHKEPASPLANTKTPSQMSLLATMPSVHTSFASTPMSILSYSRPETLKAKQITILDSAAPARPPAASSEQIGSTTLWSPTGSGRMRKGKLDEKELSDQLTRQLDLNERKS
ncbi:hypothetical protein L204_100263 [Cryptococcus depauperatus]|nr:hypothetical protein L204_02259 [Cryptococcus depauperatus CBS 7855]